ncbi:sigma factor-like helix-turn-helix DNA-binding protein [Campylobacter pinnipediorum]|uniref:sigma factor-like helix-turn-helix DNA-binding protein n=1 Tax=Campylobacter pinnipediorum TaxID=1965231 RepID=UPI00084DB2F4|nr:sigma factor-like helix-turn-helix DNA-binding protein [Campylobacter pinnipediorum]AQW80769.1 sigma-70 domain protein [Campylobacter pinnipediorum subsp. pinnipediorum]AQW83345.1 sigma-70 domain protein [Campylobacter pinnipediorum subsp. pinnipediorum]OPA75412.1 hypothetical protein BFG05_05940 [Campylobacter pinnipediorum subsp. pinnipediorum]
MTYEQIAQILSLSKERVRQIEKTAIAKLSHPRNTRKWEQIKQSIDEIEQEKAKRVNLKKDVGCINIPKLQD